jgi:two-component system, chemotaxis family, protein-glutamate methylesterase/glutaminase
MSRIRVLIVDDAVVLRRLVSEELNKDPALEVVGTAPNGRIALARLPQVSPDVVILDIEMPEMDGLATLKEIRKSYPRLPVIMFSALTERGAEATLDALALGASDYFTKPSNTGGLEASLAVIREQLIPEIKALCGKSAPGQKDSSPRKPISGIPRPGPSSEPGPARVLAIGASTGGPVALAEIFRRLPADFPVPIVVAQHMPPMFTRLLAERLTAESAIRAQEGGPNSILEPGRAWIAPGNYHMIVARNGRLVQTQLNQEPPENSCRPSVDVLFRSVAHTFGSNALAVILTGMGQDGLRGCETIREAGGRILAQDEATSVVWGMPGFVVRAGLADKVLPISLLGAEILRQVRKDALAG